MLQDEVFFFCRECDQAGYQPFLLSNTSGLQFYIKQANLTGMLPFAICSSCGSSPQTVLQLLEAGCTAPLTAAITPIRFRVNDRWVAQSLHFQGLC